jgi:hypothetical protein
MKQPRPGSVAGSTTSSFKSTRWGFAEKLEKQEQDTKFTFIPLENIKLQFEILHFISSDSFGDTMRIRKKKQHQMLEEGGCINFDEEPEE